MTLFEKNDGCLDTRIDTCHASIRQVLSVASSFFVMVLHMEQNNWEGRSSRRKIKKTNGIKASMNVKGFVSVSILLSPHLCIRASHIPSELENPILLLHSNLTFPPLTVLSPSDYIYLDKATKLNAKSAHEKIAPSA